MRTLQGRRIIGLGGGFEVDDEEENSLNEDGRVCGVSVQTGSGGSGTGFGRFARHGRSESAGGYGDIG